MGRHVILLLTAFFILAFTGTVAAEDSQGSTNNSSGLNSSEIHCLILSWDTSAGQYQIPAENVMKEYPNVKIQIRSVSQANQNLSEIPELIDWAHLIYLNNIQSGALANTILNLNSGGRLHGKTIVAEPLPYFCYPIIRLTNINNTEFVDINGTPLTDQQIQQIYTAISYSPNSLQVLAGFQQRYPRLYSLLQIRKYWTAEMACTENRMQQLLYMLATAFPGLGFQYKEPVPGTLYGIYRDRKLYTNLTEYTQLHLKPGRPTVGIVAWMSTTWEKGDLELYDSLIREFEKQGASVMVLFGQGNPTQGNHILNGIKEYFIDNETNKSRVDGIIHFTWLLGGETSRAAIDELLNRYGILVFEPITSYMDIDTWEISEGGDWSTATTMALKETQGQIVPIIIATQQNIICPNTGLLMSLTKPVDERIAKFIETVKNWINLRYLPNTEKKAALIYYNYPPGKQNIAGADSLNGLESILTIINLLKENGYNVTGIPENVDELINLLMTKGRTIATWAPGELGKLAEDATLYPVERFMEWYSKLPEITRKQMEEGPFGYIECIAKKIIATENRTSSFIDTANTLIDHWYKAMLSTIDEMGSMLTSEKISDAKNLVERTHEILQGLLVNSGSLTELQIIKNQFIALQIPGLCGWGAPPGNMMVVEKNGTKYFVIPGIRLGNIFLGPQPQRGYTDPGMLYHSTIVPPNYQYLAFYAYLQTEFSADAVIHLGRHGTYEWLPGKDVALSGADYPDICIWTMPSIYIYTMDGVGEVLHAKRRGLAVSISHLTQPFALTALNDDLLALKTLTERYMTSTDDSQKIQLLEMIKESARKLNLDTFIDLNASGAEIADKIHDYIIELESTATPLGLHVFGKDWTQEQVTSLVTTMAKKISSIALGSNNFTTPAMVIEGMPANLTDIIGKFYDNMGLNEIINYLQNSTGGTLPKQKFKASRTSTDTSMMLKQVRPENVKCYLEP